MKTTANNARHTPDKTPSEDAASAPLSPSSLLEARDGSLKRVSDVLAPLNHVQKLRVYEMIRSGQLEDMAEPVARLLIQMLNRSRLEHARRIWTGWFDALIIRDDAILTSAVRLAGGLHLCDVSAWWFALSARMEQPVRRVQETVAHLSKDRPLVEIFASEEAYGWAEDLRRRSLDALQAVQRNPAEATQLLAEVGRFRARMLKRYGVRQRDGVPRSDLELIRTILESAPAWYGITAQTMHRSDPVRVAQEMVQRGDCGNAGAALFAVAALHRRDDPALAARLHAAYPLPIVVDAILGRLQVAAERLGDLLHTVFISRPGTTPAPGVSAMGVPAAETPDGADDPLARMKHFLAWYDVVHGLELDTGDRERRVVHQLFREVSNIVHEELVPVLARRVTALTMHSPPEPLIERVRFVNEFISQLACRGIVSSGKPWRPEEGTHVAAVFRQVAGTGSSEGLRMLGQLAELGEALGFPVEITALDIALASVVEAALREQRSFDTAEMRLIDRVIAVSSDERKRCRWWVAPGVVTLLDAAARSGISKKTGA